MPPESLPGSEILAPVDRKSLAKWPWKTQALQLGLVWSGLFLAFLGDWATMVDQWWNSSTYNHVLLVPAIVCWLIWQRLPRLAGLKPQPCAWGLLAMTLALLIWVSGTMTGINTLRQAGAVALLSASLLLILGPRWFAGLLFPLCYMVFLVPFGDELIPLLQTITAHLTSALVRVSGILASIDGVFIDTPAGLFQVAEACSGVKFLMAMIALGALIGNVCFQSWYRRILFMGLCTVVPILANAVRAWGTIQAAQ